MFTKFSRASNSKRNVVNSDELSSDIPVLTVEEMNRLNKDEKLTICSNPGTPELTKEQKQALESLRSKKPWENVPLPEKSTQFSELEDIAGNLDDDLARNDEYWASHFYKFAGNGDCLLRYLRANQWSVNDAYKGLQATLSWRRKYRPHLIKPSEVEQYAETGKSYLNGYSRLMNPIIYFRNHRNNTLKDHAGNIRFLVYLVETTIALMPPGVEKVILIFDFARYTSKNSPPMNVSRYFLHLFSQHYPERLAHMFACDAPWYFWVFYKIVSPFIHPVTKAKIRFVDLRAQNSSENQAPKTPDQLLEYSGNEKESHEEPAQKNIEQPTGIFSSLFDYIHPRVLETDFGGDLSFDYNHQAYWSHLNGKLFDVKWPGVMSDSKTNKSLKNPVEE